MDSNKKLGVTHSIRDKLSFHDERLWKRFSARRLELIDTLDLSSRKASEQEQEIRKVAETLRTEFNYHPSYAPDFNKLVRAAVQSVRRNRKRSSKKHSDEDDGGRHDQIRYKKPKLEDANGHNNSFLSEIVRNDEDVYDVNYNKAKVFTNSDRAKDTIDIMTKPRLPPLSNLSMNETINIPLAANAKKVILKKIETSKSCNESVSSKLENLQFLGKSFMSTCIGFVFEKSFIHVNPQSMTYLRNKLNSETSLAKFFRDLDPINTASINDEAAVISLYVLLGGMVKDFGFEDILNPICEILYASVLQEYPLIAKNSIPYRSEEHMRRSSLNEGVRNQDGYSLSKLAEVATHLQTHSNQSTTSTLVSSRSMTPVGTPPPTASAAYKKRVHLKFFNQTLELFYSVNIAATPRFNELLENAKTAFKLPDTTIVITHHGHVIAGDLELERVFKSEEDTIELEITTHNPVPIYEMHRRMSQQVYNPAPKPTPPPVAPTPALPPQSMDSHRIILPPPIQSRNGIGFNFISNSEDAVHTVTPPPPPPQPLLPRFQPLL
ncbi:Transcription factor VHR2 [Candida viswanathii]|uniref:Transcription factor VHR2 n=1 Tax=Candida viswanathii TaxID=5486 RepID=A0A367Y9J4_9ASCO|nr:Transcription factor VHR2 [Candida viswanathii]